MHELDAARAAIDGASTVGRLTGHVEFGVGLRFQTPQRIDLSLKVAPSAEACPGRSSSPETAREHFLAVRGGIEGDLEMRTVSARLLELLSEEAPALFCDFRIDKLPDGTEIVRQMAKSELLRLRGQE